MPGGSNTEKEMKRIGTLILALCLALSLSLNVATMAFSAVATVVSSVFDAVTGTRSVMSSLTAKNADLDGQLKTSNARVATLTSDLDDRDQRIRSLQSESADLKAKNGRLTTELKSKNSEIAALAREVRNPTVRYQGSQRALSDVVSDTSSRIAKRTFRIANVSASSLVAGSIPFFGVAAGVAATTYEIDQACDTLEDLRALELALNPTAEKLEAGEQYCKVSIPTREEVWAKVRSAPGEAWEGVQQYVPELPQVNFGSAWETGLEKAGDALQSGRETLGEAADWTGEAAGEALRRGQETLGDGWDGVRDGLNELWND